jgi:hypothetical protein
LQKNIEIDKAALSLKHAMARAGVVCSEPINNDGKLHYFQPLNSKHQTGWYIVHDWCFATFGDYAKRIRQEWHYLPTALIKPLNL